MTNDHRSNAQDCLKAAQQYPTPHNASLLAQIATAEAVLALVEEQRTANFIAWTTNGDAEPTARSAQLITERLGDT